MIKDFEYLIKKILFSEAYLLKKRIKRSIKNKDEAELGLIKELSDKNKDAVDVGVYRGVYSFQLSKYYKHVYSYEPNPLLYPYLKKNLKKIATNITLENYALSDGIGEIDLRIPKRFKSIFKGNIEEIYRLGCASIHERNKFDDFSAYKVKREKLDNILKDKPIGFIKIDVEGHERAVINGSLNIIKKNKPILLVEIEERHSKIKPIETINFIESLGYNSYFLKKNILIKAQNPKEFDGVNNFIFKYA
jgi:FkbM family methyltransferase|tara:strand:- start:216 stop:959 length:744 start_codon:yes stop_codon:yes gene_type:complete